jgi:hypothetical protein
MQRSIIFREWQIRYKLIVIKFMNFAKSDLPHPGHQSCRGVQWQWSSQVSPSDSNGL